MNGLIFHIAARDVWNAAQKAGQYAAPSLTTDGFIHCSKLTQVLPVAEKFYRGQTGLILLAIDPTRLSSGLKWESPFDGAPPVGKTPAPSSGVSASEMFPHIYGPVNLDAVVQVFDFEPTVDGEFILPTVLLSGN